MSRKARKQEFDKPLKLDLGCGPNPREGFLGVDAIAFNDKVMKWDLTKPWPWKDGSVTEIHSSHFVEHLDRYARVHFWNEVYRVLKPNVKKDGQNVEGFATIIVPNWSNDRAYGDFTHCFSEDTDILTESGWKKISDVEIGENVFSLDLKTEQTNYQPVIGVIDQPYVGEMLHFNTKRMDIVVTPDHDMVWRSKCANKGYWRKKGKPAPTPILRKSPAESFSGMGGHHPRRGLGLIGWTGENPERIRFSDDKTARSGRHMPGEFDAGDFAEFIGWFVSEGHAYASSDGHYEVAIGQSRDANPKKCEQIMSLLGRMNLSPRQFKDRIKISSKNLVEFLKPLGLSHEKRVPDVIKKLCPELLERFLDAAIKGDGHQRNGYRVYATTSRALADDVQEIALKCGYRSTVSIEQRIGRQSVIGCHTLTAKYNMYLVTICKPLDLWYPHPKKINYAGNICCVTLAKQNTIFVRRNGKAMWSGNCWPPMSSFCLHYLDRDWRAANAPHNDAKYNPKGYTCHFEYVGWYTLSGLIAARNVEYKQHASQHYINANDDLCITVCRKD